MKRKGQKSVIIKTYNLIRKKKESKTEYQQVDV